jgi:hypothetical protein
MAGFTDSEVDHIAETSLQERLALQEQPA